MWRLVALACFFTQMALPQQGRTERPLGGNIYVNHDYQYEVRLPVGVKAYVNIPPNPNHGFEIRANRNDTALWVDASYDALGRGSSEAVIKNRITAAKESCGHSIPTLKQTTANLERLHATEYTLNCGDEFESEIAAIRSIGAGETSIIYEIGVKANKADEVRAKRMFERLKTGFRQMGQ